MNNLPQVYCKYELLFTPHLISKLRNLRGEAWGKLIDDLAPLPDIHNDTLAFSMMMIKLGSCLTCEMDSYRAQRGCATCARQTITSFKGSDTQLIDQYEIALQTVDQSVPKTNGKQAA